MRYWVLAIVTFFYWFLAPAQVPRPWVPAHFAGLSIGSSTSADVTRILGKPISKGRSADTGTVFWAYSTTQPIAGDLIVYFVKGVVKEIEIDPAKTIELAAIEAILGKNPKIQRYSVDDCLTSGGVAPLYIDVNGSIRKAEYSGRGIVIDLDGTTVQSIRYTTHPTGTTLSHCGMNRSLSKSPNRDQRDAPTTAGHMR